jgi:DNA primase
VSVARFPDGRDPGDLADEPDVLADAVEHADTYLAFRLGRVLAAGSLRTPEDRARLASAAMAVVNEHPDVNVRKLYAGRVAAQVGLPVADLMTSAEHPRERPHIDVTPKRRMVLANNAEFVAVVLLLQRWDDIAPWLVEALFAHDVHRRAFFALVDTDGDLDAALVIADPDAREVLERAAVADIDADPWAEARNLIAAATRRTLAELPGPVDAQRLRTTQEVRLRLDAMADDEHAQGGSGEAAAWLLAWLDERSETSGGRT